jgi:phage virion morphogenesis protein
MAGGIQGLQSIINRVGKLATHARRIEKPLKAAGVYMVGSIEKNFQVEGRPDKWQSLADSTKARRRGKNPKILTNTGRLRRSHAYKLTTEGVSVGTNAVQAARQHFGYKGGKGPGQAETPARPFLLLQDPEDFDAIGQIFMRHVKE